MSIDERANDSKNEELPNLAELPVADADQVRGGATRQPGGPVPIPYPNVVVNPGTGRSVDPCV